MPVQRERHTQIPIIPGSSLKGVLRDLWNDARAEQTALFGPESEESEHRAGTLIVGEARAIAFPVRSAQGSFAWVTCPLALTRYGREQGRTFKMEPVGDDRCLAGKGVVINGSVVLEEYCFGSDGEPPEEALHLLEGFMAMDPLAASLTERLAVVSDGIFSHFCANACEVQQRIRIDETTGTVKKGGLFNQENVPSETLFYAVMAERIKNGCLDKLASRLGDRGGVIQVGGDESIGLGLCSVALSTGGGE